MLSYLALIFLPKQESKLNTYEESVMEWFDVKLPLGYLKELLPGNFKVMEDSFWVQSDDEVIGEDWLDAYTTEILDAKYEKADT